MSLGYTWEKFHAAVDILAASDEPLRKRLASAFSGALIRLDTDVAVFPTPKSKKRFNALMRAVRATPKGNEGTITASINAMSVEECIDLATEIVSLADGISQEYALKLGQSLME